LTSVEIKSIERDKINQAVHDYAQQLRRNLMSWKGFHLACNVKFTEAWIFNTYIIYQANNRLPSQ
jgi:hypothetical protein